MLKRSGCFTDKNVLGKFDGQHQVPRFRHIDIINKLPVVCLFNHILNNSKVNQLFSRPSTMIASNLFNVDNVANDVDNEYKR